MAVFRPISISMWRDKTFSKLDTSEKLFWVYLLTNTYTKQCGIYRSTSREMSMYSGLSTEVIELLLKRFDDSYGLIKYDKDTEEVCILNWFKYHSNDSANVLKCIQDELSEVESYELVKEMQSNCQVKKIKTLFLNRQKSLKFKHGLDGGVEEQCEEGEPSQVIDNQTHLKPLASKEEKEKEKEKKEEENSTSPIYFFETKQAITKHLNKAIKKKEWLELTDGLDKDVPTIIEEVADAWIGKDRPFNPKSISNQKGVVTFARSWCENLPRHISKQSETKETIISEKSLGNNPDAIYEFIETTLRRPMPHGEKEYCRPIVENLLKKGVLRLDKFKEEYPEMVKYLPKAKNLTALFEGYERFVTYI